MSLRFFGGLSRAAWASAGLGFKGVPTMPKRQLPKPKMSNTTMKMFSMYSKSNSGRLASSWPKPSAYPAT